jgi:hypothetical protein
MKRQEESKINCLVFVWQTYEFLLLEKVYLKKQILKVTTVSCKETAKSILEKLFAAF